MRFIHAVSSLVVVLALDPTPLVAHDIHGHHPDSAHDPKTPWMQPEKNPDPDRFRQLDEILPTPSRVRTAGGAPGSEYWQQQADYDIDVRLDPERHRLIGSERITYRNNSPEALEYLWVQLDENRFREDSWGRLREPAPHVCEHAPHEDHSVTSQWRGHASPPQTSSSTSL